MCQLPPLQSLPIDEQKDNFLSTLDNNRFVLVVGETGCGKSTRIPVYCAQKYFYDCRKVICTQPRRIAARMLANRVKTEVQNAFGVGYAVRFDVTVQPNTKLVYCTTGYLMRIMQQDSRLTGYSVVIVDEVHERALNTDLFIALLKRVATSNYNLKFVFMSATMDTELFRRYLLQDNEQFSCGLIMVKGRTFEVEKKFLRARAEDPLASSVDLILDIHRKKAPGDILVFLPGEEEIEKVCEEVRKRISELHDANILDVDLVCVPLYGALLEDEQTEAFKRYETCRKCVVATNIAESSLTIDGIVHVVDSGLAKHVKYDEKKGMEYLVTGRISKASAEQRAERAGRTQNGFCYRLYTEQAYKNQMFKETPPEILRSNLTSMVLQIVAIKLGKIGELRFFDKPPSTAIESAFNTLHFLGALDAYGNISHIGEKMAKLPVEPQLARALISSAEDHGCLGEMLTIAAVLSAQQSIFLVPKKKSDLENFHTTMRKFINRYGDHITIMNIFHKFMFEGGSNENERRAWCRTHFLRYNALHEANFIRKQLVTIMGQLGYNTAFDEDWISNPNYLVNINKSLLRGYFMQTANRSEGANFHPFINPQMTVVPDKITAIKPDSADFVIYHKIVGTADKHFMRTISWIDQKWIFEMPDARQFFEF